MSSWLQALLKLVFFTVLLPFSLTFLHLLHAQERSHLLFIGPVSDSTASNLFGLYHGISNEKHKAPALFEKVMDMPRWHSHWPSIAHVSTILATPTSTLLKRDSTSTDTPQAIVEYNVKQQAWCAHTVASSINQQVCSSPTRDSTIPPSGIWTSSDGGGTTSIQVLYGDYSHRQVSPVMTTSKYDNDPNILANKFRRNPNKPTRVNRNLQQVLDRPATSLLIATNVVIALIYFNRGTNPSAVSKIYNKIVYEGEYWRAFTGATAHFDLMHIGFNMMSLYSLGTELESSYGSIPFLFYNISLIPITTCIMTGLMYLQIRHTGDTAIGEQQTVGYSGVLFAWMVIASLERQETCPIPFLPEVCFTTHSFGRLRFNVSPLVQLVVFQVLLRRTSFVGHLAGIVAGFLLHWHLLPLELVQPCVVIPGLFLILLWKARGTLPVKGRGGCSEAASQDDDERLNMTTSSPKPSGGRLDGRRIKQERQESFHGLLVFSRTVLIVTVAISALVFDVLGGMFLAPLFGLAFYCCCVKSHALLLDTPRDSVEYENEKKRLGTLWKGFILSAVLTIVCDCMSMAGWIMSSVYWQSEHGTTVRLAHACILLVLRVLVLIATLIVAAKSLSDIAETGGGLFVIVFGSTVLDNARIISTALCSRKPKNSTWIAFGGEGVSLGTVSNVSPEAESSHVV